MPTRDPALHPLRTALRALVDHDLHNPDDDPHLSGVLFFCATDERSRQLIEQVELLAYDALIDPVGQPIHARLENISEGGITASVGPRGAEHETVIEIALAGKGVVTIKAAQS
ncbi:hypothetical protein [Pseudomonas alabamensis]|jgi:hypothetical protein|uniref:hypothetical protein n=1 Tax=Pseudomonas alabamensis TaxID=3064349 RepID=UPI000745B534|nr:hypothetical protein APT63_09035 [Pseudomonas monteilii]